MPKFTVIVPVYNVEKYLDECVQSVINQTFTDWELLLVDDGSTDSSPQMCDNYSSVDSRIKVLHQKNGGASAARNNGLDNASGEYVVFLDSDDYYNDKNALDYLNSKTKTKNPDIIMFGCTDYNMQTGEVRISRSGYDIDFIENAPYEKALSHLLSNKIIPGGPTVFAASKSVIDKNNIRFKLGIQDEDYDYVLSVFIKSNSISVLNNPFYSYRKGRADSVTGSSNIKMIEGIAYTVEKWVSLCESLDDEQLKKDLLNYIAFIYTTGFVVSGRMDKQTRKKALSIMRKYRFVLDYGYWKKTRLTKIISAFSGDDLFSRAAAVYLKKTHL